MSETPTHVEMQFKDVKDTIQVPLARVARYEGRGWTRVDVTDTGKPYSKWKKDALEAEVARRNSERSEDEQIEVGGTGTVADLAAALDADDA